jgi:beta-glucanase (GH16 family)
MLVNILSEMFPEDSMQRRTAIALLICTAGTAFGEDAGFVDDFKALGRNWRVADYDFSHPSFRTDWRKEQAWISDGLRLVLEPKRDPLNRFVGASLRRIEKTGYGMYEADIRPARGTGLVTGFFTYTGPHYGDRHDEIDIEFLGQNTSRIHLSWFVDGQLQTRAIDLGYDAADGVDRYGFEWLPDRISWYVQDRLIFEHRVADGPVPSLPGYLFLNVWAAGEPLKKWAGTPAGGLTSAAHVRFVRYRQPPSARP